MWETMACMYMPTISLYLYQPAIFSLSAIVASLSASAWFWAASATPSIMLAVSSSTTPTFGVVCMWTQCLVSHLSLSLSLITIANITLCNVCMSINRHTRFLNDQLGNLSSQFCTTSNRLWDSTLWFSFWVILIVIRWLPNLYTCTVRCLRSSRWMNAQCRTYRATREGAIDSCHRIKKDPGSPILRDRLFSGFCKWKLDSTFPLPIVRYNYYMLAMEIQCMLYIVPY